MHGAVVCLLGRVQASSCKLAARTDLVQSNHQLRSAFQCGYHLGRDCAYFVPCKRRPPTTSAAACVAVQPATATAKPTCGRSAAAAGAAGWSSTTATATAGQHVGC